ncbi:MAG: hypothetical protein JKX97_00790 [Candidatus Lindowbacteria bacterium]|nr:hypothetical protein [Candidatus Lindowbacteria bacterium]
MVNTGKMVFGLVLVAFFVAAVDAAPVVVIAPAKGKWAASGHVHKLSERNTDLSQTAGSKVDVDYLVYIGRVHYGLSDRVEIYGELGSVSAGLNQTSGTLLFNDISTGSELIWGAGIQGILHDAKTWNIGMDLQYLSTKDLTGPAVGGATNGLPWTIDWTEWHVAVQAQTTIEGFIPWVGVKYSDATVENLRINGAPDPRELEASDNVGVYGGVATMIGDKTAVYVEGRFIDETAFGGGIKYNF